MPTINTKHKYKRLSPSSLTKMTNLKHDNFPLAQKAEDSTEYAL